MRRNYTHELSSRSLANRLHGDTFVAPAPQLTREICVSKGDSNFGLSHAR